MEPTRRLTDADMLFHYTTSEGIRGIVENGELWATGARYLNDLKELRLVFEATASVLELDYLKQRPDLKESIEWAIMMFRGDSSAVPYYVTSFSTLPNALSQWRGYGGSGQAYVLGLVKEDLARHAAQQGWKLVKVQYGMQAAMRAASAVVAHGFQRIDAGDFYQWDDRNRVQAALRLGLLNIAAEHKDDAFHEEQEWRLISTRLQAMAGDKISFRSNRKGLVPYVKFPLWKDRFLLPGRPSGQEEYGEMLDLGEVSAGPGATNDTMDALSELLNVHNAHLRRGGTRSNIPYSA